MINNIKIPKCYKVSHFNDSNNLNLFVGDIMYLRKSPFVYMKRENDWELYEKIYYEKDHPKHNIDLKTISGQYIFIINNETILNSIPAKVGDLIYRSGDQFMYIKELNDTDISYKKIYKYW